MAIRFNTPNLIRLIPSKAEGIIYYLATKYTAVHKCLWLVGWLFFTTVQAQTGKPYFQQAVNYEINVQLNDDNHSLEASLRLTYTNNSADTLHFIWFHLWPNAYKHDHTAFSEQFLMNNRTDFYFSSDKDKGFMHGLNFTVADVAAKFEQSDSIPDVIKLLLPQPLLPGQQTVIQTPFHVQLPACFSRSGHKEQFYQVTQWYPKPAVYDAYGWHPMPYLDQGEFYSEIGSFNVHITLPSNYQVAASGINTDTVAYQQVKLLGNTKAHEQPAYKYYFQAVNTKTFEKGKRTIRAFEQLAPPSSAEKKTWHFTLSQAHDFAWFASKQFIVEYDTLVNADGKTIDVFAYYHPWQTDEWQRSTQLAKRGIHFYSNQLGQYPYPAATIVAGNPYEGVGGMEYPGITIINTQAGGKELDLTIAHELGHNWFYGALASNERQHAWMDESMNTFYQNKYEERYYKLPNINTRSAYDFSARKGMDDLETNIAAQLQKAFKSQPIDAPAATYTAMNYGLMVYDRGAKWMEALEKKLGTQTFNTAMKQYYQQWQNKHPYPIDFKKSIEASSGKNIDTLFQQLTVSRPAMFEAQAPKQLKFTGLFSNYQTNQYQYLSLMPLVGYNNSDGLMLGGLLHNLQLPLPNLQLMAAPLYGTSSKTWGGFAKLNFVQYGNAKKWNAGISFLKYNYGRFTPENANPLFLAVQRIVPAVTYTHYNKDLRSKEKWELSFKTFLLNEQNLRFNNDTNATVRVGKISVNSYVNRLSFNWSNSRKLYPYDVNLTIDQGSKFARIGLTGNCYFNYAEQKGGIEARFFAGKFIYLAPQTYLTQAQTYRYNLNLSAPDGGDDYTYSGYFLGRSEFQGYRSQQIMQRDGFFKVNTRMNAAQVGRTDNWLMAVNLAADIPNQYNPLSILPIKLPLKVFVDAGTYAEAWEDNAATGRFLYDAGLQLSLFKNLVNIYVPILSSSVFSDYQKSVLGNNRFWKTVSFSIDIQRLKPSFISNELPL